VGDAWFDQLVRSGHHDRADDLDALAGLGVAALRYPVLWERTTRRVGDAPDFAWSDARLARLRALGVEPIVGLLHHGSGPAGTDLLDPRFPERLADYAGAVARRYPWVEKWTPVNEPLTTARFSGLYGHWYPHRRDDRAFAAMLLNQCRGTQLAMRAVRREVPGAQLVQTEDLGMTLSRPRLAYQAEFENERRWLSYDLLCGRVDGHHPLARWLRGLGVADDELAPLRDEPPPDLLGLNHYVTSVRFLDDRTGLYPPARVGGNHRHRYVDVEAVRVCASPPGVDALLHQAWERFRRPLAVTEAHLGCTEDEQVRWLAEVWEAASRLRRAGADLRAVTAWALLGSYDWHCLVTRADGCYEPGAFDVRDGAPRPTALAALIRGLADTGAPRHPALASPGWWRRPERLLHPPVRHARRAPAQLAV
jgi:dTDP-4-dehydrorhamnose reductase